MGNALSLVVAVGVPLIGGVVGGLATKRDVKGWYKDLEKPTWTPPNWVFAPVWSALYTGIGVASWVVFTKGSKRAVPLTLYAVQLVLNFAWSPLFFNQHKVDVALADLLALLGVASAATISMSKSAKPAQVLPLMLPYLAWSVYATALTGNIWLNNPEESALVKPRDVSRALHQTKTKAEETSKKAATVAKDAGHKAADSAQKVAAPVAAKAKEVAGAAQSGAAHAVAKAQELTHQAAAAPAATPAAEPAAEAAP